MPARRLHFSPRKRSEIDTFPAKNESSPHDLHIKNRGWVLARIFFFERGERDEVINESSLRFLNQSSLLTRESHTYSLVRLDRRQANQG